MQERILVILLVALLAVLVAQCNGKVYHPDFKTTEAVQLTPDGTHNEDACLLRAKDGTIYLTWFSMRDGNPDIFLMTSKDGKQWSEQTAIIKGGRARNFYPQITQTKDDTFHLVWFRIDDDSNAFSIWYANSGDGRTWSEAQALTPRDKGHNWVPTIVAANDGSIWVAWSSGRTGNKDVFVMQSKDNGKNWQEPVQVTTHQFNDDLPNIAQKPDGTFIVVWTNYKPGRSDYLSKTADIYFATSRDGREWTGPVAITNNDYTDSIPEVYGNLDRSEYFVAWCSPVGTWDLPLSNITSQPRHLLDSKTGGYSPRLLPLSDKDYLVVWTGKHNKELHIFSYLMDKSVIVRKEASPVKETPGSR